MAVDSPALEDLPGDIEDAMADVFYELTFRRVESNFDAGSGETEQTPHEWTCQGIRTEYSKRMVADGAVQANDRRFLIAQTTLTNDLDEPVTPKPGDQIVHDGVAYTIAEGGVSQDPAEATWDIQARA